MWNKVEKYETNMKKIWNKYARKISRSMKQTGSESLPLIWTLLAYPTPGNLLTNIVRIFFFKYFLQFEQIHFAIWKFIIGTFDTYILKNICWNVVRRCNWDKHMLQFGQIHLQFKQILSLVLRKTFQLPGHLSHAWQPLNVGHVAGASIDNSMKDTIQQFRWM